MPFLRLLIGLSKAILWLLLSASLAAGLLVALRPSPGDNPFAPLDLDAPIGLATRAKLVELDDQGDRCRALLTRAGVRFRALPPRESRATCQIADAIAPTAGGTAIRYEPAAPTFACPLAAALLLWEHEVVQPAARAALGSEVVAIDHLGTYSCRRVYGGAEGAWSRHAQARAIDVAGFRLADGRRISVARDWAPRGARSEFLHRVRNGGCRLFSTTLSPDYNAAHRDHFHLDLGVGWGGFCA